MIAILLVDHGSRRVEANATLVEMADRLRALRPKLLCLHAHMELAQPDIATSFTALVVAGATEVRVVPYFLAPGRHASTDIPALVEAAASAHPGVTWHVAPCLGPHDLLAELVLLRAEK